MKATTWRKIQTGSLGGKTIMNQLQSAEIDIVTPEGTILRKGQKWLECDNRFRRVVTVTGWDVQRAKVQLNGRTWAALKRFSGKAKGYEPLQP